MPQYPYLLHETLYPGVGEEPIALGTPAWIDWVRTHTTFTCRNATAQFAMRREGRPGGQYWYAYKRRAGKLQKRYAGRGEDLTEQRLQELARSLSEDDTARAEPTALPSLLATRFTFPRLAAHTLERPRLLDRFCQAIERPGLLITAAAGYGKTTLLAMGCEQLRKQGWQIAWLTLEISERDQARFWLYALTALERVVPGSAHAALTLLQDSAQPDILATLTLLINTLSEEQASLVLVLDDYHLAATAENTATLLFLLEHMPPGLRLLISSRTEPALPLARLYVQSKLSELRQDDLRFSHAETALFLTRTIGPKVTDEQITTLEQQTEGWIAGLQLAVHALSQQSVNNWPLADTAFHHHYIERYLLTEVLDKQTPEIRDFLQSTSILARMCATLCDAVTGRNDGQAMLQYLTSSNLFVVALDQQQCWYRYHHLFAAMLRKRMAQDHPEALDVCHERAAHWLATQGDIPTAIEHAIAAHAYPLAAELIASRTEALLLQGEIGTLSRWLQALPSSTLEINPRLALYAILVALLKNETGYATLALVRLDRSLSLREIEPLLRGELAGVKAFHLLLAAQDVNEARTCASEALRYLPPEHGFIGDMAALLHAALTNLESQADLSQTVQQLTRTALSSLRRGNYALASFALQNRALKELIQARLHQAERTCQEALHMAELAQVEGWSFAGWAYMQLGRIYFEWNQLERARETLLSGLAWDYMRQAPETSVDGYLTLARVYEVQGDWENADRAMHEIELAIQLTPVMPHTVWQIESCRARLHCASGNLAEAEIWAARYEAYLDQNPPATSPQFQDWCDFALARIRKAQGRYEVAQSLLENLLLSAQTGGRTRSVIEATLLLALVEQTRGTLDHPMALLASALQLAAPESIIRLFLDEGQPMFDLLARYLTTRAIDAQLHSSTVTYARHLLAHYPSATRQPASALLPEPLSSREQEILLLLATGKSSEDIAAALFLTLSTVKWHLAHLYRKLGVHTRVQALTRARQLKLLDQ